jgi:DNA-binding NtrC family response regulator
MPATLSPAPAPLPSPTATGSWDILLVDDDATIRVMLERTLHKQGYSVVCAANGQEALAWVTRSRFRLVITDIFMPDSDGLDLIMACSVGHPAMPILAISGGGRLGGPDTFLKPARLLGSRRTLAKPFELPEFLRVVAELIG